MSGKTYTDDDIERWAADAENGMRAATTCIS